MELNFVWFDVSVLLCISLCRVIAVVKDLSASKPLITVARL
jgi:hypothetical protein